MKRTRRYISLFLVCAMLLSMTVTGFAATTRDESGAVLGTVPGNAPQEPVAGNAQPSRASSLFEADWTRSEQYVQLASPAPWNAHELKQVVDVTDPRSVAAYWTWAVYRLSQDYDGGMSMMKYLFADIEPYGPGFTEGGMSGRAGWDTYFNDRLKDPNYQWLPRAFFANGDASTGLPIMHPLWLRLVYDAEATESYNAQSYESLGRLNIVYFIENITLYPYYRVEIRLSKFAGSDRWYVTNANSSSLMYKQVTSDFIAQNMDKIKANEGDPTTLEEHIRRYGTEEKPVEAHEHSFVFKYANGEHWRECELCGEKTAPDFHTDYFIDHQYQNGHIFECSVCGYTSELGDHNFNPYFFDGTVCVHCRLSEEEIAKLPLYEAAGTTEPEPKPEEKKFTDVKEGDYYYDAVQWAIENKVTSGTTESTFSPDMLVDRSQMVTFLWKAAGEPDPEQWNNPFTDVSETDWFYTAVLWAVDQGIINGTTPTTFSPKGDCSSAMVVTLLYRVNGGPLNTPGLWYQEAKDWAAANGFARGTGLEISQEESCPRGAIVTFLFRNDQGI